MFYCPEKFAKNPAAELNPQSKKKVCCKLGAIIHYLEFLIALIKVEMIVSNKAFLQSQNINYFIDCIVNSINGFEVDWISVQPEIINILTDKIPWVTTEEPKPFYSLIV